MRIATILLALATLAAAATAEIVTEDVPYRHLDVQLQGYLAYDDALSGPRPAVIVVHEWWGLNDFAKQKARALAELGYVAFALDMYGRGKVTSDPSQAGTWAGAIRRDLKQFRARARAGYDIVAQHERVDRDRIGAIGFCFGGSTVLQMAAAGMPLAGVVSFHGSLFAFEADDVRRTQAKLLVLHGAADPLVPDKDVAAFQQSLADSKVDWQLVAYGGAEHSFTNPGADEHGIKGVKYDKTAAQRSWRHMKIFFDEVLKK
jgi:dienelactone hydrolase